MTARPITRMTVHLPPGMTLDNSKAEQPAETAVTDPAPVTS